MNKHPNVNYLPRLSKSNAVFQARVKSLRHFAGLSQMQAAAGLGIEKKQISQYENGKLMPNMRTLIKLCDFYQVTPNYLLGFKEANINEKLSKTKTF